MLQHWGRSGASAAQPARGSSKPLPPNCLLTVDTLQGAALYVQVREQAGMPQGRGGTADGSTTNTAA